MAGIPNVTPYKKGEDFDRWIRGLDYYFVANKVTNVDQKKATLMHILGLDIQDIFETLPTSEEDAALDAYKSTCLKLKRYFSPKMNRVYERFKFNEMIQGDESMENFISRLRVQAARCGFSAEEKDTHVCDRAISGCRDMELKQRLLLKSELNPTLDNIITWSNSYEMCR